MGRKLSRLSGNFPDHPENIQPIRKLSRLSGNFPDNPENIQTIWKFSKGSGNFPVQFQGLRAKTFRTCKNFPDGNATLPPRFLGLCITANTTFIMGALLYYFQNIFRPQDTYFAAALKPDAAVALTSNSILKYSCSGDLQGFKKRYFNIHNSLYST